jgi:hypothetical protein
MIESGVGFHAGSLLGMGWICAGGEATEQKYAERQALRPGVSRREAQPRKDCMTMLIARRELATWRVESTEARLRHRSHRVPFWAMLSGCGRKTLQDVPAHLSDRVRKPHTRSTALWTGLLLQCQLRQSACVIAVWPPLLHLECGEDSTKVTLT